jgi:hypothetical protein
MSSGVSDLADVYRGATAVVMGGAPSLSYALTHCPDEAIYISANHHGALLRPVDFIVYTDRLHQVTYAPMSYVLRQYGAPLVSVREEADYRVPEMFAGNSGLQAILFACMIGCDPVIVTGIEMFKGKTYFHDPDYPSSGFDKDPAFTKRAIRDLVELTQGCNVVQIGCNLPFAAYDKFANYPTAVRPEWMRDIMGF